MKIEDYTNCNKLIIQANNIYKNIDKTKIDKDYLMYFESMNKYINKYKLYRESLINKYLKDLIEYNEFKSNR